MAAVDGARTQAYDSKADIFSLAMVYYFVWERALPGIPECNKPPLHLAALRQGRRPSYGRTPKPIRELVNHMWRLEAQDRPSAADVLDYLYNVKHKPTFGGGVLKSNTTRHRWSVRRGAAGAGPLTLNFLPTQNLVLYSSSKNIDSSVLVTRHMDRGHAASAGELDARSSRGRRASRR